MKVTVSRKAHFNAAHRLHRKDWTDEKNNAVFGKCNNANFHGHNYELTVSVSGAIDPETGYVIDIKDLGWQCRGNIFELNFTVLDRHNRKLAAIKQKMVSMHDKYKIEVYDTTHLDMIITLLITIQHMVIDEEKEKRS